MRSSSLSLLERPSRPTVISSSPRILPRCSRSTASPQSARGAVDCATMARRSTCAMAPAPCRIRSTTAPAFPGPPGLEEAVAPWSCSMPHLTMTSEDRGGPRDRPSTPVPARRQPTSLQPTLPGVIERELRKPPRQPAPGAPLALTKTGLGPRVRLRSVMAMVMTTPC